MEQLRSSQHEDRSLLVWYPIHSDIPPQFLYGCIDIPFCYSLLLHQSKTSCLLTLDGLFNCILAALALTGGLWAGLRTASGLSSWSSSAPLISHGWRQRGHRSWDRCCCSHFMIQCIWKWWSHLPQTGGHSSPGILQYGHVPSNGCRQIPQSSSLTFHFQIATACQWFTLTLIGIFQADNDWNNRFFSRPERWSVDALDTW